MNIDLCCKEQSGFNIIVRLIEKHWNLFVYQTPPQGSFSYDRNKSSFNANCD